MKWMILFLAFFVSVYFFQPIVFVTNDQNSEIIMNQKYKQFSLETYKAKHNIGNIIALVFYGRESSVSILLKYLEKNLKSNGGILDKIVFAVKTNTTQDIKFLDKYLEFKNNNEYERKNFGAYNKHYKELYKNFHDNDLVFKIDDDIVFISNGTFERMIEEYLKNDLLILSANVVNHPVLTYVHEKIGAILPFILFKMENGTKSSNNIVQKLSKRKKVSKYPVIGAITHESFFTHYKNKNLKIYDFGLWDFHS